MVLPIAVVALAALWSFGAALALALCRTATLGDRAVQRLPAPSGPPASSAPRMTLASVGVAPVHPSKRPVGGLNP